MTKSEKTYELEEVITLATWKLGRYGCPEVGLGDAGIVDFISIELGKNRNIRCYELKISKSDFMSSAKKTFIGEYNYYVIPTELWDDVKGLIEPGIGCWCVDKDGFAKIRKSARRRECALPKKYITMRVLQALSRENLKHVERSWRSRQDRKPVKDFKGNPLHVGDVVEWSDSRWTVEDIEKKHSGTVLKPLCILKPLDMTGKKTRVSPSVVRKITDLL